MIACGVKGEEAIVGHAEGSVGIKVRHAGLAEVVERLNQCVIVRGFLGSVRETLRLDCQVFSSVVGVVVGSINDHRIPRERFVWPLAPEIIAVATRRACARAHNPLRRVVALEASAAAAAVKLLRRHSAPSAEQRLAAHKGLLPQSVTTVYLQQHACPPSAHHPFRNERDASQREDLPATTIKHLSSLQQQTRPARIPLCRSRRAELGQRRNSPRWGSLSTVLALLALPLRGGKKKMKICSILPPAFPLVTWTWGAMLLLQVQLAAVAVVLLMLLAVVCYRLERRLCSLNATIATLAERGSLHPGANVRRAPARRHTLPPATPSGVLDGSSCRGMSPARVPSAGSPVRVPSGDCSGLVRTQSTDRANLNEAGPDGTYVPSRVSSGIALAPSRVSSGDRSGSPNGSASQHSALQSPTLSPRAARSDSAGSQAKGSAIPSAVRSSAVVPYSKWKQEMQGQAMDSGDGGDRVKHILEVCACLYAFDA